MPPLTEQHTKRPKTSVGTFEKTERAIRERPFDSFYTVNMSSEPPVKVKYHEENRFEGKSSYYHYYPSGSIVEQRLEAGVWEHQNRKL